jgi:hypothetical protein
VRPAGRLLLGPSYECARNPTAKGISWGWEDLSKRRVTPGGQRYADEGARLRTLRLPFDRLSTTQSDEFEALKLARAFDFAIWVDASERAPSEGADSCTVTLNMADYVLDNNVPVEDLPAKLDAFMKGIIS